MVFAHKHVFSIVIAWGLRYSVSMSAVATPHHQFFTQFHHTLPSVFILIFAFGKCCDEEGCEVSDDIKRPMMFCDSRDEGVGGEGGFGDL